MDEHETDMSSTQTRGRRTPVDGADVCIIGGGIAGGLVAYSLSQQGHDVVILEAGPWMDGVDRRDRMEKALRPEHSGGEIWEQGIDERRDKFTTSVPSNLGVRLNHNRLKAVGGTTLHWAAHAPRMLEKDFNMNSRYGLAVDWPIDYSDLQPYYARAEAEIGVAGGGDNPFVPRDVDPPMDAHPPSPTDTLFQEVCERLGIRTHSNPLAINSEVYDNRSQCVGFSTCSPVCPSGAKYTGDIHIRKAIDQGTALLDQVPVKRLEHDSVGSSLASAVYVTPDGTERRQYADHFVLACGGIEIPRLLLLSDSLQHPDGLANSSGLVGKHLHFECTVEVEAEFNGRTNDQPIGFLTTVSEEFYDHDDSQPGSFRLRFRNADPQSPLSVALGARSPISEPFRGAPWGDDLLDHMEQASENTTLRVDAQVEMLPHRDNTITLDESETDSLGNPVPHVSVDVGDHVVETGSAAIEKIRTILDELGATITDISDPADQKLQYHHKGTTRMGTDPNTSVVDPQLRTHDVRNLWVVSSSVYPTGGAVNPTLTIAALALYAADNIDDQL
jgi:choline dehydrogenase-like flavoprotein